jgi:tetratricopeptide (TPR) repeat protein
VKKSSNVAYYLAASVAVLALLVYLPALQNNFVEWDDGDYASANPHIRSLDVAFLKWAFLQFFASNWHPLTWVSHALDYAVWGLDPFGHHLTSIALHAINAFLVVFLVIRLPEDFNKAIELNGEYAAAYYNRGTFYRNTRRKELAVADFRRALFRS